MEIVQAQDTDLQEIINLLKISLGEALMPKSEAYFLWKHFRNPFGKSIIYLAKENGKIVGIRTFMHWRWVNQNDTINSLRAVDTATHPNFQGRGIFSKLTMKGVDTAIQNNWGFVFNTPNPISMKGYLKLGWYSIGKMPIYMRRGSLIPRSFNLEAIEKIYEKYSIKSCTHRLAEGWEIKSHSDILHTPISLEYLNWRYVDCPVASYGAVIEPNQFGIVFRIKKVRHFTELRICEIWTENQESYVLLNKSLNRLIRNIRPLIVTCNPSCLIHSPKHLPNNFWGPFKKGPTITLRHLAMNNLNIFESFSQWKPSLGSMELF